MRWTFARCNQAPQNDHQTAISNRQIGGKHGAPIRLVFAQSSETRPGRRDEKSPMVRHQRDRFIHIAIEEANAENLVTRDHKMNIESATSNIEHRISNI